MLTTPLCEALGFDVPILNVGFGTGARAELAAAVSNAGGLGVLGSLPPDHLRPELARVRALTERPFGVNVILAFLDHPDAGPLTRARVDVCLEERVPVLVLFWGDPAPFVEPAHAVGTKVFVQVGSVEEARAAAAAGVDAVIAQGSEAGGHVKSRTPIWEILPACIEAVAPTPVLASGGIGDGAGIARALSLGAQGVSLGTAFLAAAEADIHDEYRRRVVEATRDDTVYTESLFDANWADAPHRALRARTYDEWDAAGRPPSGERPGEGETIGTLREPWREVEVPRYASFMTTTSFEGDVAYAPLWAGESVDHVREVEPAAQIVRRLAQEAEAALQAAG